VRIHQKKPTYEVADEVQPQQRQEAVWKILIVDDEPDVIKITKINLKNFVYIGRRLEFIEAESAKEARERLDIHSDIALALIDVVMETDDAGLRLIDYIRNKLGNKLIRLVIRTGQPGQAPERTIIDKYDVNDYKDKTELTAQKLYTTVRFSLKEFYNIVMLENTRQALSHIIQVTPHLYNLKLSYLEQYFHWVLTQIIYVFRLGHTGMISTIEGMLATFEGTDVKLQATIGDFELDSFNEKRREEIFEICKKVVLENHHPRGLRAESIVIPLKTSKHVLGFVYMECNQDIQNKDLDMVQVLVNQCTAGLDNFKLHHDLEKSYDQSIDMLAIVSEFKDQTIAGHIDRIQELTKRLSIALGLNDQEVELYTKASRLHDIGKVGIPDNILCKPARLSPEEFKIIIKHTTFGDKILEKAPNLEMARIVARSHHENWNGSGYPQGLCGTEIPMVARIVSVVDVFDALASPRPYKKAWAIPDIIDELESCSIVKFDPIVIATFLRILKSGELDDLIKEYDNHSDST